MDEIQEVLNFYCFDFIVLKKETLSVDKLDMLCLAAFKLSFMPLYHKLLSLKTTLIQNITYLISRRPVEIIDEDDDETEDRKRENRRLEVENVAAVDWQLLFDSLEI